MARRWNHYEAAFEAFLRASRIPYVAVDERRRSLVANGSLKNLDFIVSPPSRSSWLVDVKGRKFPGGEGARHYWKNWTQHEDLISLERWEELFGNEFGGLFVFAYHLVADRSPLPAEQVFAFRDMQYAFVGIRLSEYRRLARPISGSWDTVAMPVQSFREIAQPLHCFFDPLVASESV